MIKRIRVMLEYHCYPVWLYDEDDDVIDTPDDVISDFFFCKIYSNAIQIKLSNRHAEMVIVSKDIVWELGSNGNLISLTVHNQSADVINHTLKELNC